MGVTTPWAWLFLSIATHLTECRLLTLKKIRSKRVLRWTALTVQNPVLPIESPLCVANDILEMLLGLPNELVRGVLAGAGGQGVALASCCCTRLREAADQLKQQPIFCSATSTANELNEAIKDATHRAMAGSWGEAPV